MRNNISSYWSISDKLFSPVCLFESFKNIYSTFFLRAAGCEESVRDIF